MNFLDYRKERAPLGSRNDPPLAAIFGAASVAADLLLWNGSDLLFDVCLLGVLCANTAIVTSFSGLFLGLMGLGDPERRTMSLAGILLACCGTIGFVAFVIHIVRNLPKC